MYFRSMITGEYLELLKGYYLAYNVFQLAEGQSLAKEKVKFCEKGVMCTPVRLTLDPPCTII